MPKEPFALWASVMLWFVTHNIKSHHPTFSDSAFYSCLGINILISYLISFFNSSHRISTYQLRTNFRSKFIKIYRLLSFSKIPLALEISSFIELYGDIETCIGIVNL